MNKAAPIIILIYAIALTAYIIYDKFTANPLNDLEMNATTYFTCAFGPNWKSLTNEMLIYNWDIYNPKVHINSTDNFKESVKKVYFSQAYKCDPGKILEKVININDITFPKNLKSGS